MFIFQIALISNHPSHVCSGHMIAIIAIAEGSKG
jgi:hypothetical protein